MPRFFTKLLIGLMLGVALASAAAETGAADRGTARPDPAQVAREIDASLAAELFTGDVQLAPAVNDATFFRRAWLDLVGDIPSPEHVTAFLLDPAPDKRERAVRDLLASSAYGQNWARYWRDVIFYRQLGDGSEPVANSLVVDLAEQLNRNEPWNEIASEFVTVTGDAHEHSAAAIVVAQRGQTEEITAEVSRIFLGVQIQCAQCHDHPYDRWKREDFHELAAFFPRVGLRSAVAPARRSVEVMHNDRADPPEKLKEAFELRRGTPEHYMPDLADPSSRGTQMQPKFFLTGAELSVGTPDAQRRAELARWMTESPWFATAYVNRIWSELVGEGFYEPIDDLGPDRTPTGPKTIELLTERFIESGYDTKWLMETVMATKAYQRQSRPRRAHADTPFTANVAQPLRSDQLYNAILSALALDETDRVLERNKRPRANDKSPTARQDFETAFGYDPSNPRESVSSSIPQALAMMNLPKLNQAIVRPKADGLLTQLLTQIEDDDALIVELYLRTLSREPTDAELDRALAYRGDSLGRRAAFEDLLWALLNSSEFSHRR